MLTSTSGCGVPKSARIERRALTLAAIAHVVHDGYTDLSVTARLEREWRRFTPLKRLARFAFYLFAVAAAVLALQTIDVIPEFLYDGPAQIAELLTRMWPPDPGYITPTI